MASGEMTEDEFIRFLNETLVLISSHAAGGAIVYAYMDWRHMGEMPADIFVIAAAVDVSCSQLCWRPNSAKGSATSSDFAAVPAWWDKFSGRNR